MFNRKNPAKNSFMLTGSFRKQGYDWWWHSFTATDDETGAEKAFFVEFFTCNPDLGWEKPVLGQLPQNRQNGLRPSYLMVKAGCWGEEHCQLHRFFGWKDVQVHKNAPYSISADDCFASDNALRGSLRITPEEADAHPEWMCGSGEMTFDLKLDKQIAFNVGYGTSPLLRAIKAFEMYWHAEGMKTAVSGTVTLNGRRYTVRPETSFGYADKNWGSNFTSPWVWLASSALKSNITGKTLSNSAFDIGGGRPKIYFVPLERKLLGAFCYEGEEFDFNFSHFWLMVRTDFSSEETDEEIIWHVRQENLFAVMETEVHCRKRDMLLVNYESPDGEKRHNRLWNGGNGVGSVKLYRKKGGKTELVDDIAATHIGCEYGEYDR